MIGPADLVARLDCTPTPKGHTILARERDGEVDVEWSTRRFARRVAVITWTTGGGFEFVHCDGNGDLAGSRDAADEQGLLVQLQRLVEVL
ncbi:MAG: hypothetical protein AAF561_00020 [Planctomycetota bacterium]